jgi:hypothetical protein
MIMRVAAYALLLDIMLHYQFYYNININRMFQAMHPLEVAWAGYFTLNFMCSPASLRPKMIHALALTRRLPRPAGTSSSPSYGACSGCGLCATAWLRRRTCCGVLTTTTRSPGFGGNGTLHSTSGSYDTYTFPSAAAAARFGACGLYSPLSGCGTTCGGAGLRGPGSTAAASRQSSVYSFSSRPKLCHASPTARAWFAILSLLPVPSTSCCSCMRVPPLLTLLPLTFTPFLHACEPGHYARL